MNDGKSRRAMFAELLLVADPVSIGERPDGTIDIEFASVAALLAWLTAAGLDGPDSHREYTGDRDGRPYRIAIAHPTWQGRDTYARVHEFVDVADLAPDVHAHLSTLAAAA